MKIEKLIESVNRISDEEQKIREHFDENCHIFFFDIETEIITLKNVLMNEQRRQEAVKSGSNDIYKAFCRILKDATKDALQYAWKDSEDRLCACNGFVAIRLKNAKFSLPMAEKPAINLDTLFANKDNASRVHDETTPDVADLKAYQKNIIAEYKAKYSAKGIKAMPDGIPHYYKFESGPAVNTKYLIDVLDIIPNAVFEWSASHPLAAIYASGEAGEALVMPCKINNEVILDRTTRDSAALRNGNYFAA